MAGSLCGSAWAESLPIGSTAATEWNKDVKNYVLVLNGNAYGFTNVDDDGVITEEVKDVTAADFKNVKDFIWTVTQTEVTGGNYEYTFTNVRWGKTLRVNTTQNKVDNGIAGADDKFASKFVFDKGAGTVYPAYGTSCGLLSAYVDANTQKKLSWSLTRVNGIYSAIDDATAVGNVEFYAVETSDITSADDLNILYNNSGFSFEVDAKDIQGNLFGDKKIVAESVPVGGETIDNLKSLSIPKGMYFFTNKVMKSATEIDWLASTVLAVSSTETVEATNAERANGNGFELVEVKVGDMNLYTGSEKAKKSSKSEISIYNAAFSVDYSYTSGHPYALTLKNFRYKEKAAEDAHKEAEVQLVVLTHSDVNYLATKKTGDKSYIFKMAETTAIKGISLLKEEAKAAIYNIRFLNGDKNNVQSVYNKYLTVGRRSSSFEWTAKGEVLADLNSPMYQFVITDVNGTKVTFTNRETDKAFTATLFPEEAENTYTWSIDGASNTDVASIYVNENTYEEKVTTVSTHIKRLGDCTIELIPVEEVDPYYGFLNVDNKTLVTMAFARDNYETSNKVYATVEGNDLVDEYSFATETSNAAQWQLLKDAKPTKLQERSYVYNNDGKVTVKAKGDIVYAYKYALRYIADGTEQNEYFPTSVGGTSANSLTPSSSKNFVIKEYKDGAVAIINSSSINAGVTSVVKVTQSGRNPAEYVAPTSAFAYANESKATDLKTYLIEEAPEVSYPAVDGHISLISELGNYISMNEEHDGIVVNEEQYTFYLQATDKDAIVPSFYISKGIKDGGNAASERLFLFNPNDSVQYYVAAGQYDKNYEWSKNVVKAIFKAGTLEANMDTMATSIKGKLVNVADNADNKGTFGGLKNFKVQIIQAEDAEGMYVIRTIGNYSNGERYLYGINDKLAWGIKDQAMKFTITAGDPTSNESIADAAEGVKVIAGNGVVEIQGAAGKKVIVSNILGKVVAETVLTSDNATIAVPAGIIAVSVDGEAAVKAVVK